MNRYGLGGMEMHSQLSIATTFVFFLRRIVAGWMFKYDMIPLSLQNYQYGTIVWLCNFSNRFLCYGQLGVELTV